MYRYQKQRDHPLTVLYVQPMLPAADASCSAFEKAAAIWGIIAGLCEHAGEAACISDQNGWQCAVQYNTFG